MKIYKSGEANRDFDAQELAAVNAFAKSKLNAEDVYIFSVLLCDNDIDRDNERFSVECLKQLSELFVGATGICDHEWKSDNQVARIYRTEVVRDDTRKTALGEDYVYLKGWAYMLKTEENAELIAEIDGGIRKETSVGCSVAHSTCSICGKEHGSLDCTHIKGQQYDGRLCYAELNGAVDAYEWSFVAVPAQKNAGVMKSMGKAVSLKALVEASNDQTCLREYENLANEAAMGRRYMQSMREEVLRLSLVCDEKQYAALKGCIAYMDEAALMSMKQSLEARSAQLFPSVTQLPGRDETTAFDGGEYLI